MTLLRPILRPLLTPTLRAVTDAGVGGWTPASIPGLVAWYRPADIASLSQDSTGSAPVTAAGQPVGRVRDKSPLGNNASQASDAARPTLQQDAFGYYHLSTDGADDGMLATLAALPDAVSVFVAMEWNASANPQLALGVTAANWGRLSLYIRTSAPRYGFSAFSDAGSGAVTAGEYSAEKVVLGAIATRAGTQQIYRNAREAGSAGAAGSYAFAEQECGLAGASGPFAALRGKVYEVVIFSTAISESERVRLCQYLARSYGDVGEFATIGDSHTAGMVTPTYPDLLETGLRAAARNYVGFNLGVSGNTTANMVARSSAFVDPVTPSFAVLYGGANDPPSGTTVQAVPSPTDTTFAVASGFGVRFAEGGIITVNGEQATIQSVATDTITLASALSFTPVAGQPVSIDTTANLAKMATDLRAAGCSRVLILGAHFHNWASGGETVETPLASYQALRGKQSVAATQAGAAYLNLFDAFAAKITDGTYLQGDDLAWHTAVGNIHLNANGNQIVADAVQAKLVELGWV